MIITRSPLRISLGGGGTDLPSFYQQHGGFVVSAAIDKYVYVTVMRPFEEGIFLKYSKLERKKKVSEIKHPIIRETLRTLNLKTPQVEITTLAEIPAGTGLGSSGSFTTSLIKALYAHYKRPIQTKELAELACEIEIMKLGQPIGKQDQYISAYGGITEFEFLKDGNVNVSALELSMSTILDLEDNLLLFYTGHSRSANTILKDQNVKSKNKQNSVLKNLEDTKELGFRIRNCLVEGRTEDFAAMMNEHWFIKRGRSVKITNDFIDFAYDHAIRGGALGGKLVGAGGGGFLMLYAEDREKLRSHMRSINLEEVRFKFDFEGTRAL